MRLQIDKVKFPVAFKVDDDSLILIDAQKTELCWDSDLYMVADLANDLHNELSSLRQERDALKARVEELEEETDMWKEEIRQGCAIFNSLTFLQVNQLYLDVQSWLQRNKPKGGDNECSNVKDGE